MSSRKQKLLQQFSNIDVNNDKYISKDELYMYLDKKNGNRKYDRVIAEQIWGKMDKNMNNEVTVEEFVNVYMFAEEILKEKIMSTQRDYDEFLQQR